MTPTDELKAALAAFDAAHKAAEQASRRHWELKQEYDALKTTTEAGVWGDKQYPNDTLRKAEVSARLRAGGAEQFVADAEAKKTAAAATLARAEQALKTHRALIGHYTSELTLEAARIQAGRDAIAGQFYGDNLPF